VDNSVSSQRCSNSLDIETEGTLCGYSDDVVMVKIMESTDDVEKSGREIRIPMTDGSEELVPSINNKKDRTAMQQTCHKKDQCHSSYTFLFWSLFSLQ